MNISICHTINQLSYVFVFETKLRENCSLISELWIQEIHDEENIPKEIGIEEEIENNSFIHITEINKKW